MTRTPLVSIYKDPQQPIELRVDAAKAAVRYEKPALAAVDITQELNATVRTVSDQPITPEQWLAEVKGSGSA